MSIQSTDEGLLDGIAIVGMAGRFPGARSVAEFWQNQLAGVEGISQFSVEELEVLNAAEVAADPNYIRARGILKDIDLFDASFFGILPKEAELMDPQQRLFLECGWEAIETAGYDPLHVPGSVGVFAGSSLSSYFLSHVCARPGFVDDFTSNYQIGNYPAMMGNSLDFLSTRVSFKLNLTGPSVTTLSACSTSLMAVCQACQSLLTYQCDAALAGGASITLPQKRGSHYQEGGMASRDGHCRTFDADAQGTVFGSGVGVVLLKRLEDALRDGDTVHAVIRGFAINNDGSVKASYTAPSVDGQSKVIALAQEIAGVPAETIGYIEAHGTATPLGDPIELEALSRAFRAQTEAKNFCVIGTAKTNVGHLDIAAGVTGLIHAAHIVREGKLPPTLHFRKPNPRFDLASSPFKVNTILREWPRQNHPRRAGVSAFGVGGTNAHLILEQPPEAQPDSPAREHQILLLSAKTRTALDAMSTQLADRLDPHSAVNLADVAYTLQQGRGAFQYRSAIVVSSAEEAARILRDPASRAMLRADQPFDHPRIVFCFPGQGVQSLLMAHDLYRTERVFRNALDRCSEILAPLIGARLIDLIYPAEATSEAADRLNETLIAQPAIFSIEYALAQLWLSWGIRPDAMTGHSIGEYVAVCLAGALSLEDALRIVAERGRLMQSMPRGSMLAVRASEEQTRALIASLPDADLDLAAVNAPQLCVVAGSADAIASFANLVDGRRIGHRALATSHAFHSRLVEGALEPFERFLRGVSFGKLSIPCVSTLTGEWLTAEVVAQPEYWVRQLRRTVRFADAIRTLASTPKSVFLEVGPNETLIQLMRQTLKSEPAINEGSERSVAIASLPASRDRISSGKGVQTALANLWLAGVVPDWAAFHGESARKRVPLPTYPFERKRYWVEPIRDVHADAKTAPTEPASPPFIEQLIAEDLIMANSDSSDTTVHSSIALGDIKALITDLSGLDLTDVDPDSAFLELGFDSLFLTQLTQGIQSKYKIKMTFRQIMENYPTIGTLASYVQATANPALLASGSPQSSPAPAPVAAPTANVAVAVSAQPAHLFAAAPSGQFPAGTLESLFAAQTQALTGLFQQQLAALGAQAAQAIALPAPTQAQPAVAAQPVVVVKPSVAPQQSAAASVEKVPAKSTFTPFKPLNRGEDGGLNQTQQAYLNALVAEYNQRTPTSKRFTQDHRSVFADGRVVSGFHAQLKELIYPLVVDRAKGAYLWDKDGNRFIDIVNGYGAILYGHSPGFVVEAVHRQLDIGFPIGPQTELVGECSELIRELTGMDRVTFCNTGSEAVMGAMRLSRTVTGRNLVVMFSGDYHGSFDEVLAKSVGGHRTMPAAPGIPRESVANMLVLDYGTDESLEIIRSRADEIAAVLVEPVQSRHPELRPVEFLREVRRITEQSGAALIFDEVVTGFRTHPGGMQAVYGIRADLATYGKVVAGGLPVGVLTGRPEYMDALDGGFWQYGDNSFPQVGVTFYAGTFMRHPLSMAAVQASLRHLKEMGPALQENLATRTSGLVQGIRKLFEEFSHPSSVETYASWFYLPVATDPFLARMLHFHMRNQGVHIQEGFPCFLTTAHTPADIDFIHEAFHTSLRQMHSVKSTAKTFDRLDISRDAVQALTAVEPRNAEPLVQEFPITEPQREILLGAEMGDDANCAFNESTTLILKGNLDEAALFTGIQNLVDRHQALRLTFSKATESARVASHLEAFTEDDDLSELSESDRSVHLKSIIEHEGATPFNLETGPLFRIRLLRTLPSEHLLVFTAHHIIFDGWSTNVFFNELSELYNAAVSGRESSLPAPLTFSEYVAAQLEHDATMDQKTAEEYWLERFKTVPSPLQIPTDRPRSAVRTFKGATKNFMVDPELFKSVRKAGARQGSTLFATLLGAFAFLMHRLCDQGDIVVGIPMAGQSRVENGSTLVGHCVNFLPIRSAFDPNMPLKDFFKQTRGTLMDAYDHQDCTYGTLLHKLRLPRDPSRQMLIELQANVEQVGASLEFSNLTADLRANGKTHVNMDLFFNFIDRGSELWLDCDYNTGLFDDSTIDRWFSHLEQILRSFVEDADEPCTRVSLLTTQQQEQILTEWNQTAATYPSGSSIHRVFEEQARRTPDAVALVSQGQSLSYAELDEKSNQLARYLLRSGVTPGSRVALCFQRSLEVAVSLLAVLKAGAAYIPIDPTYPEARLQYLVKDSGAKVLLTQQAVASALPDFHTTVLCVDHEWPAVALEDTDTLATEVKPDDLAYVIYTSGSTGNPKGVLVPHRAVLRLVKNNPFASFQSDEVFLQLAPLSFDASTFEIWGALLNGCRLILGPADRTTPEDIAKMIAEHKVTTLWLTAALFHLMVVEHLEALRPLRQLLAGGDVLSLTHVRRVCEQLPHLRLINGYGPTENTTFTCCHPITLDSLGGGTVPIGRPIANTRIYILDPQRKPVPVGASGELYAAGDGLALGYLNAPELTAEKFVTHSFANGTTERLYRTGDLARYRANGTVEFLGRIDTQVKIRGYRIELAEIEYALEQSPMVKAAVVAVRTDLTPANDSSVDKRLVAYVVLAGGVDPAEAVAALRLTLEQSLPEYMRPAAIMVLDSLPRTNNGKIDRRALPAPVSEQLLRKRDAVAPSTPEEKTLAEIWSKVLGISEIGIEDSIFELGGDSLLIFRITTLAQQAGLPINARQIFQFRTIAAISAQIHKSGNEISSSKKIAPIQAISRTQFRKKLTTIQ